MESKEFKALKEQLLSCRRNGFDRMDAAERSAMESYCTDYKAFLDTSKTERLCAGEVVRLAEQAGYRPYVRGAAVKPGDKVYTVTGARACCWPTSGRSRWRRVFRSLPPT